MRKLTTEEFVEKAKKIHGDKYDYSNVEYKGKRQKIKIICPIHGEFWQLAGNHMRGQGCPQCGKLYAMTWNQNNFQHFINESKKRFGDKFEFPNIENEYLNSHSKITFICKDCGNVFTKTACDHITSINGGCIKCNCQTSNAEKNLGFFIQQILPNDKTILFNDRTILKGKEIDIFIPDLKLGIEYNGLYWHSEKQGKGKWYHYDKMMECNKKGIKLIQIFEDEYLNNKYNLVLEKDTVKVILKEKTDDKPVSSEATEIESASNDVFFKKLDDETISKLGLPVFDRKNKRETPYDSEMFNYDVFVRVKKNPTRAKKYASKKKTPEKVYANYNSAGYSNSYNSS